MTLSTITFAAASVTDFIDGRLARKYHQVTVFGQLLDPVADKMLTTAALLVFLQAGLCSIWAVMLILTREFAVTGLRLIASAQGIVIPAGVSGKIKTAAQMVSIFLILPMGEAVQSVSWFAARTQLYYTVSDALVWLTTVLAVVSGVIYFVQAKKRIDFFK